MTDAFGDEANIAYVGFTRAIRELHLPRDFKTILTPGWQEAIERYKPVQVARTPKLPNVNRKRAPCPGLPDTRSGKFTIEADLPRPPRKKPFKVGDRVRTGHGTGTVMEVAPSNPPTLIDILHRILWLMENEPRKLNDYLDEARPDRERLRLVAQALAGTELEGGSVRALESERAGGYSTPKELAALKKLLANWKALIEKPLSSMPLFDIGRDK